MYQSVENRIRQLPDDIGRYLASGGAVGLEKESLRVSEDGGISQRPHPPALGSALTHPYITTDYSEALAELITPPFVRSGQALDFLRDTQKFVYDHLDNEYLWATSMPCVLDGGDNIPLAYYGTSNAGIMKNVYRRGLGHRYGRTMQVIAGVHFNFSFDEAFWPLYREFRRSRLTQREFSDAAYLGLIRNLQRFGWLIPYLFGASPAVCKSFLGDKPTDLLEFDRHTYYEPYATSLRMGDIGYTNSKEKGVGIKANYNSLESYIRSLTHAIETPCPMWEEIGVEVNGRYEQLNANILQIENEYYSTVRPKQVLEGLEKPTLALRRRGVRYIELRSLDVNAFDPLGVSEEQLHFLRAFMVFCLLLESPPINVQERREIDQNIGGAAHRGRDPLLYLSRLGRDIRLNDWAGELLQAMEPVCELLDKWDADQPYRQALLQQQACVAEPDRTPSARMLQEMREQGEGFFHFARRKSLQHRDYFNGFIPDAERYRMFRQETEASLIRQQEMEQQDKGDFARFLADYFAQR
ncbi:glutamate--cysteine ligase [Sedimenticola hydrogenitrophicus]|uniref:glutamate--cysteine ligase n=1 Tax=Sedimenticola hydrogenitrophicus TaxID=2967975 RepID=UPI0021A610F0|nr:glutamate--cysteine ligase [Sedimenticola hydrogenitrophicus]